MTPFGVLADDLTGACDTGVPFSARGARVLVLVTPAAAIPPAPDDAPWEALVLNTDSRHLPDAQAALRSAAAAARLAAAGFPLRYKKIDSTLRGPWAAELPPLLNGAAALLLAPAFPAARRTVQSGMLLVAGVPVHETEIGRDRLNPVPESHLPSLLQGLGRVEQITLTDLVWGLRGAKQRLAELRAEGVRAIVADAASPAHLEALAAALAQAWQAGGERAAVLAVGSAGLAAALAEELLPEPGAPALPPLFPRAGPVLVLAGSRTAVTRDQVKSLQAAPGVHARVLEPGELDADDWDADLQHGKATGWVSAHAAALRQAAQAGAHTLLVSIAPGTPEQAPEEEPPRYARRSARLNAALGALVAALAAPSPQSGPPDRSAGSALGGLVLTGGDIARAALRALEGEALQLGPQVLPGIALGWPVGGAQPGLPIVTKAGGFGGPEALRQAVHFLRHGAAGS